MCCNCVLPWTAVMLLSCTAACLPVSWWRLCHGALVWGVEGRGSSNVTLPSLLAHPTTFPARGHALDPPIWRPFPPPSTFLRPVPYVHAPAATKAAAGQPCGWFSGGGAPPAAERAAVYGRHAELSIFQLHKESMVGRSGAWVCVMNSEGEVREGMGRRRQAGT